MKKKIIEGHHKSKFCLYDNEEENGTNDNNVLKIYFTKLIM